MPTPETYRSSAALLSAGQLRKRYIVALSLIALLTIVSQVVVQLLILDQEHDSRIVNIAGRQRMLSQKISKLSLYIVNAESIAGASGFRTQLEETLSLWQSSHLGLLRGNSAMELPGRNSDEVIALFAAIEPHHQAIVGATRTLLSSLGNGAALDRENALIREHEPLFLKGMNDIVFLYDREAKQKIAFARWLEVSLLVVTLTVLMLEALFIFAPATRRIQSDMQALADREEDLERLFEASPTAMLLIDNGDLSILNANQKAMELLGLSSRHPSAGKLHDHLQVDDPENRRFLASVGTQTLIDEHELALIDARGTPLNTLASVRKMQFSGRPVFVLGITDITERKQVEAELSIAATAFEAQEGMFITNARKEILRVNQAFIGITGYSAEEVIGKTPSLMRSDRHDASFYAAMYESIARTGAWQGEIWNRRKNGESFPEWLTITAVRDGKGKLTHYVSTLTDITLRKAAENAIQHLAFYDPLTQLPNRRLLLDRLQHALAGSSRSLREGALLFIDLDHFKTLNDTLGHDKGDQLLQQVATRLTGSVREGDTVARLGGDEFVVMLENLSSSASEATIQTRAIGEKILAALNQPYDLSGHAYRSTPSIGIALFADHQNSIEDLMKRADLAMYEAKAAGRNTLRFFDPQMRTADTTPDTADTA